MPRRKNVVKRKVVPDAKYKDVVATKLINRMMSKGEKSIAERVFYGAMEIIEQKSDEPPMRVVRKALSNVKPVVEVKSRRVGGATYQVPVEVRAERRDALAMRWLVGFARERSGKSMREKLAAEILDAAKGEGASVRKKDEMHKMAEANKAFAHYRW